MSCCCGDISDLGQRLHLADREPHDVAMCGLLLVPRGVVGARDGAVLAAWQLPAQREPPARGAACAEEDPAPARPPAAESPVAAEEAALAAERHLRQRDVDPR